MYRYYQTISTLHEHYHSSHIVCTICEASPHVIESGSPIAFRDTREYVEHMQSYHSSHSHSSSSNNNNNQKITFRIGNTYHSQYNQNAKSSSSSSYNNSNSRVLPYVDLQMGSANPYNNNNNNNINNNNNSSSGYNNTISMEGYNRHNEATIVMTTGTRIDRDNNIYRRDHTSAPILQSQIIPSHMRIAGKVSGMNLLCYI
jgi:hypothetical protein